MSMQVSRHAARTALASLALVGALALPFVAPAAVSAAVPQSPPGWSRKVVIQNAQRWVAQRVPYSQTRWYRGYRQDCSGFVSMAWNIHASYPTGMMNRIAKPIPKDALQPGDILLNNTGTGAHVVLFERWSGPGKRYYIGYEQLSSTNRPVRRLIPYPYFRHQQRYRPYRFTGLPPKPAPKAAPSRPASVQPVARKVAASSPPAAAPRGSATPLQFAFVLTLVSAGGLAWGLTGRFLE